MVLYLGGLYQHDFIRALRLYNSYASRVIYLLFLPPEWIIVPFNETKSGLNWLFLTYSFCSFILPMIVLLWLLYFRISYHIMIFTTISISPNLVTLKFVPRWETPKGFLQFRISGPYALNFWFKKSGVELNNSHFKQIPL